MPVMYKMELLPGCGNHVLGLDTNGKVVKVVGEKNKGVFFASEEDLSEKFVNKFKCHGKVEVKGSDPLLLRDTIPPPMTAEEKEEEGEEIPSSEALQDEKGKLLKIKQIKDSGYQIYQKGDKFDVYTDKGKLVASYDNKKAAIKAAKK